MHSSTGIFGAFLSLELSRWAKARVLSTIGVVAVMVCSCMSVASAQSTFGSILGTVQDPSGAAVIACKVTIRNKGTDTQRSTVTD